MNPICKQCDSEIAGSWYGHPAGGWMCASCKIESLYKLLERVREKFINDHACQQKGCCNWASSGYIYCAIHLHGSPSPMDAGTAKHKLALEKK